MLVIHNLNVKVGQGTPMERAILQNLSLHVASGECVMVIGGNGAGKSTLFNAISGFAPITQGSIVLNGQDITRRSIYERAPDVAKVLQDPRLATIESMTIEENMSLAFKRGKIRGLSSCTSKERKALFSEKLALLDMGLELRLHEPVSNLSGGGRQALSLIMALLQPSHILLLDEMTAALDPKMAELVMRLAVRIVTQEKRTTLMITHNMQHALTYGDRLVVLDQGRITHDFDDASKVSMTPGDLAGFFV